MVFKEATDRRKLAGDACKLCTGTTTTGTRKCTSQIGFVSLQSCNRNKQTFCNQALYSVTLENNEKGKPDACLSVHGRGCDTLIDTIDSLKSEGTGSYRVKLVTNEGGRGGGGGTRKN